MNLIKEAQSLYLEIQNLTEIKYQKQMRIASICVELCDIKQGNYRDKPRYSLSKFAQESGIPRSSIKEWVDTLKRVIPIVGVSQIDSNDKWNRAKKVAAKYRKRDRPTPEAIQDYFDEDSEPTIIDEFRDYEKQMRALLVFLEKRDLGLLEAQALSRFMSQLDIASDIINDFLTAQSKKTRLTVVV